MCLGRCWRCWWFHIYFLFGNFVRFSCLFESSKCPSHPFLSFIIFSVLIWQFSLNMNVEQQMASVCLCLFASHHFFLFSFVRTWLQCKIWTWWAFVLRSGLKKERNEKIYLETSVKFFVLCLLFDVVGKVFTDRRHIYSPLECNFMIKPWLSLSLKKHAKNVEMAYSSLIAFHHVSVNLYVWKVYSN